MASADRDTILIVEDDPGAARLQQLRLERGGYQVRIVDSSDAALREVREKNVNLLLIDQHLPGDVSGLELYKQVQALGLGVPAILVTGVTGDSIVLEAFRAGVFDFVPKTPDYLDYLMPTVERVLQKQRTEHQLADSEARLSGIIASAMDAVLTVDEHLGIGLFNPAAEVMFGCPAADVIGQPITQFLPQWPGRNLLTEAGGGLHSFRWETDALRHDGERFPVDVAVSRVKSPRGRFWTCLARDIRDLKRAQEERERLIREQAARREAEAAKGQMEAAAEENARLYHEMRRADRFKDEFLAMLSHELRNPMAPIRNALNLIQLTPSVLDAPVIENIALIERQVNHLVRLVDDLLDVNRIRQGKIQLRKEPVVLAEVVERAVEICRPLLEARNHQLTVTLPVEPVTLDADAVRLVQVLANLLNNAAKYTEKCGQINLIGETKVSGSGAVSLILRVRDTGMGIPAEMLPRLFDVFTQSQRTLDRAEGGLGIGLMLVRRLVEMHGGSVQVHSEGPERGSEFVVRLPVYSAAPCPPSAPAPRQAKVPYQCRRVLLIDDNLDSTVTLGRLISLLGHHVETALTGPQALEAAERQSPEIVLLDIGLPGMDGYEVARRLRENPRNEDAVLVALTGYGSPEDRRRSREAGFQVHLVKPVDLETLKALLADPLAMTSGSQQSWRGNE